MEAGNIHWRLHKLFKCVQFQYAFVEREVPNTALTDKRNGSD